MKPEANFPLATTSRRELQPPSRLAILGEARFPVERLSMRSVLGRLQRSVPKGDGQPVLVAPGFATDDSWTQSLRSFLCSIGYDCRGWGLGRNHGRVDALIPQLVDRTAVLAEATGTPVRLVGWSLGGYLVREVAREMPNVVDRVVTLGAPVVGGPKYTASAPWYVKRGYNLDKIESDVADRERSPIETPIHALYSRSDGVVAWRACIDDSNPEVVHHEVTASHVGLIVSPEVFRRIAHLL